MKCLLAWIITSSVFLLHSQPAQTATSDVWVLVHNSDQRSDYLTTDRMTRSGSIKKFQAFFDSLKVKIRIAGLNSLDGLDSAAQEILQKGEQLKGLALIGHGNEDVFLFNSKESYSGAELADVLAKHLANVPLASNFGIYLGSCLGACKSKAGDNIQTELGNELWKKLGTLHKKITQLDVVAHKGTSGSNGLARMPALRWFVRTGLPGKINSVMTRLSHSAYSMLALEFTPAIVGMLAPVFTKVGLPPELAGAAFMGGLYTSVGLTLARKASDTAVVLQSIKKDEKSVEDRLILADAFKLAALNGINCEAHLIGDPAKMSDEK